MNYDIPTSIMSIKSVNELPLCRHLIFGFGSGEKPMDSEILTLYFAFVIKLQSRQTCFFQWN